MNVATEMPMPFVFTDSAAGKVKELIEEEGNPELKLRVFVTGGGCSGFQYGFTFDEVANDDDTALQKNGVTLLVDPMSYQYLVGAEIDYTRRARRFAVCDQEPQCIFDLRLRFVVLGLGEKQAAVLQAARRRRTVDHWATARSRQTFLRRSESMAQAAVSFSASRPVIKRD
jgi:iron-sulfur cluster insertion protein